VTTEMADHPWMQKEEAFFLRYPRKVFGPAEFEALQAVQQRIGLEYFGIDCALDGQGNIVVFEVNASMRVHQRNASFPYKDAPVQRIKDAFAAMLRKRLRPPRPQVL